MGLRDFIEIVKESRLTDGVWTSVSSRELKTLAEKHDRHTSLTESKTSPADRFETVIYDYMRGIRGASVDLQVEDDREVSIQKLYVDPIERRTRLASEIMEKITKTASKRRIILYLEALPDENEEDDDGDVLENISLNDLVGFYRRYGFEGRIVGNSAMMTRYP